jgi:putative SbcD/Mre11-related phosphoesterase
LIFENSLSTTAELLPGLLAHPSGALWIPESRTALIADAHLGYSWAQRRRGELGPLADLAAKEKLLRLAAELNPRQFVFLGDLVHAPRPCQPEREWIEDLLTQLSRRAPIVAVRGNHDRAFAREFGHLNLTHVETWAANGLLAIHGDRLAHAPIPDSGTLVMGHLHPSLALRDASGANQRLPLFLLAIPHHCIVLPAFSPFARGFDVREGFPAELDRYFRASEIHAFAATAKRVIALGPLQRAIERMLDSTPATPGHFRRRSRAKA